MSTSQILDGVMPHLAVGLAELVEKGFSYPYPPALQRAMNSLAILMPLNGRYFPANIHSAFLLFEQPVGEWWPGALPPELDGRLPLLDFGRLDEQVAAYLFEHELDNLEGQSVSQIQAIIDHMPFKEIVDRSRADPDALSEEYNAVRKFIIRHPYIRRHQLALPADIILFRDQLLQLYEPASPHCIQQSKYWVCPHCGGILRWLEEKPYCAKPRLCKAITQNYRGRQPIALDHDVWCLKWAIQMRVCLPGLPELALLEWLLEIQGNSPDRLTGVGLWPACDQYDLRLEYSDGSAWAIDVKDYTNPVGLAAKLSRQFTLAGRTDAVLRWDEGFFVVPDYREMLSPGYMQELRQSGLQLAADTFLVTEDIFRSRVLGKVRSL